MERVSKWQIVRDIMQEDADRINELEQALMQILHSAAYVKGEALPQLHELNVGRKYLDHARKVLGLN